MKRFPPIAFILVTICFISNSINAQFPDFPPQDVTNTMDRDQMVWQLGISFPALPAKLDDPNAPEDAYPIDPDDPEGNWTDDRGMGNTVQRSGFGLWNNYHDFSYGFTPCPDSLRAGDYTPIDLLKMNDSGQIITTPEERWEQRRPEVLKDVQEQVWGVIPHDSILPEVTWSVETSTGGSGQSAYIQKAITGTIDISRHPQVRKFILILHPEN